MPRYHRVGDIPPKRHTRHRRTDGGFLGEGIHYEEVITADGFAAEYAILYHLRPPTRLRDVQPAGRIEVRRAETSALRHVLLPTGNMPRGGEPVLGRVPLLTNDDVTMWRCRPDRAQAELYRNGAADELIYFHRGAGRVETPFGVLAYRDMDYVLLPRGTTYRIVPDAPAASTGDGRPVEDHLIIEGRSAIRIPPHYRNAAGQLRLGAPYGERDLHPPEGPLVVDREGDTTVLVKDGPRLSRHVLAHHPFDVVGWDGCLWPLRFHAMDFEPVTGAIHQPPPVQQTFDARGFVVCTFAPRMLDTHPDAIKVPYAHANVHADEVLFYSRGRFGSRRGVEEAGITLHPRGLPHGPHPGTIVASRDMVRTDELAVMMDTESPLHPTPEALAMEDPAYTASWIC